MIVTNARAAVFVELQRLLNQYNATQVHADPDTRWYPEDDMGALLIKLNAELSRARKRQPVLCVRECEIIVTV